MIAAERGSLDIYGNHYTELKDRLIYQNLAPKAQSEGQAELSLGLIGMLSEEPLYYETGNPRSPRFKNDDWSWNADYSNLLFSELDKRLAIRVREYYTMLTSKPKDDFYAYVIKANYNDADYYNDLIGTKYLAEGNFNDAEQYLKKVSLSFLNKQNIGGYMAKRDWSRERWFGKQKIKDDNIEGPGHATLSSNPKLLFSSCSSARKQRTWSLNTSLRAARNACNWPTSWPRFTIRHHGRATAGISPTTDIASPTLHALARKTTSPMPFACWQRAAAPPTPTCVPRVSTPWPSFPLTPGPRLR